MPFRPGILRVKLALLDDWNERRHQAADRYRELLTEANTAELVPYEPDWAKSVYHLYVTRVPERESVMRQLADAHIGTGIHYPVPLHLQKAYEYLGYKAGDFPVSEMLAPEILSLPMFPQLTAEQQARVVDGIANCVAPEKAGAMLQELANAAVAR